jgi:hypothetical protein
MNLSFNKHGQLHVPIKKWDLDDGNVLVIYQGSRGANPDLDFIVKYKAPNKRLRAPSHTHWIVDLIVKSSHSSSDVCDFVSDWIELYDKIEPFNSVEERANYKLIYNEYFCDTYTTIDNLGHLSVEFLSALIELFIKCEKQTPGAFMFKNLLQLVRDFCNDKKDFYQLVSYSKRV